MILNIPLQIDEANIEQMVKKEYDNKVIEAVVNRLEEGLAKNQVGWSRAEKASNGLVYLMERTADDFLEKYRDKIIDVTADRLVERLRRTKAVKEMVNGVKEKEDGADKQTGGD